MSKSPFDKISKSSIKLPTLKILEELIESAHAEIISLRLKFKDEFKEEEFLPQFFYFSLQRVIDIGLSIKKLISSDLISINILMRSILETVVDFLWIYSIHLDDRNYSEKLAKRFFQFGAKDFLSTEVDFERFTYNDFFIKEIKEKLNPLQQIFNAKKTKIIEICPKNITRDKRKLYNKKWRALPELIQNINEINFSSRADKAIQVAKDICNLKNPSYKENWAILNRFTHLTSATMPKYESEVTGILYLRSLNLCLGYIHDTLQITYDYLNIIPPEGIRMDRQKFLYYST